MILQKITLHNIRSYIDETITFPEGSTLLAGEIGCGKSTILLATEFALFGLARPDLPGELLLRKGTVNGSVELTFLLEGKEITIKRSLKKEKDAIKQQSGFLIVDGIKKELTPVELKAEILQYLGYPEDLLSKNKNYIFRYTVYTPQEEMRYILQENAETRLDVLRRIFNIDKYKYIRENVGFVLKQMRAEMMILNTRLEPLPQLEEEKKTVEKEKEAMGRALEQIDRYPLQIKIQQQENLIKEWNKKQREFNDGTQEEKIVHSLYLAKQVQFRDFCIRKDDLEKQLTAFIIDDNVELVKQELKDLESQKAILIEKRSALREKIRQGEEKIKKQREDNEIVEEKIRGLDQKENFCRELEKKISCKDELYEKRKHLEELFERTAGLVTKNQTICEQARHLQQKMRSLDKCPMCLQEVTPEHKIKINAEEEQKIKQADSLLAELHKKKSEIFQQRQQVQQQIEEIIKGENLLTKTKTEIAQLKEKKLALQGQQEMLQQWTEEVALFRLELTGGNNDQTIDIIDIDITKKRDVLNQILRKKLIQEQREYVETSLKNVAQELRDLEEKKEQIRKKLQGMEDLTKTIDEGCVVLRTLQEEETKLAVEQAKIQTALARINIAEEQLRQKIETLLVEKNKLIRHTKIYNWLDSYFLPLTNAIEKQVMGNIHGFFNQLFREWFTILIEDENVYAKIDDSFTPIIEQNGYDTTFDNLSGGEKTSAALAYRLALNRVINDVVHQIKTKDVLILDEPTDGFSAHQLDKVRDVLERLNLRQTIIVSHENKIESFVENVIRVQKEGHVSRVFE